MKGLVGTVFHAQGRFFTPAPVAGFVDAPADDPCLGIAGYLDAAPLRPEAPGVMKGADQLAGFAPVAAVRTTHDSGHRIASSKVEYVFQLRNQISFCPMIRRPANDFINGDSGFPFLSLIVQIGMPVNELKRLASVPFRYPR
jgi:hypothetical protein